MPAKLTHNAYGKSLVRLTRVTRRPDRHDLKELSVDIQLEGDFAAAYLDGDNRQLVATDSMKNTVYVFAKELGVEHIESFGLALARHFLKLYPQVLQATVRLEESLWQRIAVDGTPHPHAFVGGSSEKRLSTIVATRSQVSIKSGLDGLLVLKTADSAFVDFVTDRYRTLPDATDRIFATIVAAEWTYLGAAADWDQCYDTIRAALLNVFATHKSLGVQQTLFAMGEAALAACPAIDDITLTMPNKHRIPMNLSPFGLDNANEVFIPTDEPHGLISGTIRRAEC